MRHVRGQVCVVSVVSHQQSLSYSSASICHACFQSTSITASSPDKYMSMVNTRQNVRFQISSSVNEQKSDSFSYARMTIVNNKSSALENFFVIQAQLKRTLP